MGVKNLKMREKEGGTDRGCEERGLEGNWNGQKKTSECRLPALGDCGDQSELRDPRETRCHPSMELQATRHQKGDTSDPGDLIWSVISTEAEGLINQRILGHQAKNGSYGSSGLIFLLILTPLYNAHHRGCPDPTWSCPVTEHLVPTAPGSSSKTGDSPVTGTN